MRVGVVEVRYDVSSKRALDFRAFGMSSFQRRETLVVSYLQEKKGQCW